MDTTEDVDVCESKKRGNSDVDGVEVSQFEEIVRSGYPYSYGVGYSTCQGSQKYWELKQTTGWDDNTTYQE